MVLVERKVPVAVAADSATVAVNRIAAFVADSLDVSVLASSVVLYR